MKNLFLINEDEKDRILNLHESATKRQYLSEQALDYSQPKEPVAPVATVPTLVDAGAIVKPGVTGDPYVYGKLGNDYYYAKASDGDYPNWVLATTDKAIRAIKSKIYNEKVAPLKTVKAPQKDKAKVQTPKKKTDKVDDKKVVDKTKVNKVVLSPFINPKFKSMIDVSKLSTTTPVPIFKAGQPDCAQFVNDFDDSRNVIGNAWTAHDTPSIGTTIFSSFTKLNSDQIDKVTDLWKDINSDGGGKDNGPYSKEVVELVNNLVPKSFGISLKLNDVVGLFYPGSKHHESAYYEGGKRFFRKNMIGMTVNGETIKKGIGWGMNTHVGIVGAIDNGVPIVFHNIGGQVWADPYTNMKGGARIAWVKRA
jgi:hypothetical protein